MDKTPSKSFAESLFGARSEFRTRLARDGEELMHGMVELAAARNATHSHGPQVPDLRAGRHFVKLMHQYQAAHKQARDAIALREWSFGFRSNRLRRYAVQGAERMGNSAMAQLAWARRRALRFVSHKWKPSGRIPTLPRTRMTRPREQRTPRAARRVRVGRGSDPPPPDGALVPPRRARVLALQAGGAR